MTCQVSSAKVAPIRVAWTKYLRSYTGAKGEEDALIKIAAALGVTVEGLKHFTEDSVFNNINNFHDNSIQDNFNPIEKVIEFYERLLQSEREKVEILKNSK